MSEPRIQGDSVGKSDSKGAKDMSTIYVEESLAESREGGDGETATRPRAGTKARATTLRPRGALALDHEVRRRILEILRDGERSAGEITRMLGRRWAGVSHHLTCLRFLGLVSYRRDGASLVYHLNRAAALAAWNAYLQQLFPGQAS